MPQVTFDIFNVCDGVFPKSASDFDAWLITGSKYSVYDEIDWISRLKLFVKEISLADKLYIGICFGHQMLGEAMGGKVTKSDKGWCVGVHRFDIVIHQNWMKPNRSYVNLLMSCQDQIQILPENSRIIAQTPNCPFGIIQVGNKMLGIQGHPEFSANYAMNLMEGRGNQIGQQKVLLGIESIKNQAHSREVADWIINFLNQ